MKHLKKAPGGQSRKLVYYLLLVLHIVNCLSTFLFAVIVLSDFDKWDCRTRQHFAKIFKGGELIQNKWSMNKYVGIITFAMSEICIFIDIKQCSAGAL